jgi:hypothetical protein
MVLSLKAWKSRSLPGLPRTERFILFNDFLEKSPAVRRGAFCFLAVVSPASHVRA